MGLLNDPGFWLAVIFALPGYVFKWVAIKSFGDEDYADGIFFGLLAVVMLSFTHGFLILQVLDNLYQYVVLHSYTYHAFSLWQYFKVGLLYELINALTVRVSIGD
jgi:hypothetical protein